MEEPNILIKSALHEAVQKVNAGMTPTEALKKVASELDLNPNYIQRTGEALNVALHYKHFKTASDRSQDFEIADIPKAIQDTFTFTEKTASEQISEHFSVSDTETPAFNYHRILNNPQYKRAFLEIDQAPEKHSEFPTTFRTIHEKSANHVDYLAQQLENAKVACVNAEFDLNDRFSSLAQTFKKDASYRTSFEEFESQVFSKHGEQAVPYLDLLHKTACAHEERGIHDSGYMMFEQCKEAKAFDDLMLAAKDFIETQKQAEDAAHNFSFEQSFLKDIQKSLAKKANDDKEKEDESEDEKEDEKEDESEDEKEDESEDEKEDEDPVLAEIKKKANSEQQKIAADYGDPVVEEALEKEAFFQTAARIFGATKALSGPIHGFAEEKVTSSFADSFSGKPALVSNNTLDNMERKLLLQELMLTDPILSKVNPARVARAFEQLLRLSPELSKEKEIVRAELRAMVSSQALSKFDANQFSKADIDMLKRRAATQQFGLGKTEAFRF